MNKIVCKTFFVNLQKKADWLKPKQKAQKVRYIKYFLNNGEIVNFKRERITKNYFWKFSKPLKYYLQRFRVITGILQEKELESRSKKWQIQEKIIEVEEKKIEVEEKKIEIEEKAEYEEYEEYEEIEETEEITVEERITVKS